MPTLSQGLTSGYIIRDNSPGRQSLSGSVKSGRILTDKGAQSNIPGLGYTKNPNTLANPTANRLSGTGLTIGGVPERRPPNGIQSDIAGLAKAQEIRDLNNTINPSDAAALQAALRERDATEAAIAGGQADVAGLAAAEEAAAVNLPDTNLVGQADVAGLIAAEAGLGAPANRETDDWRVRISLPPGFQYLYNDASNTLMAPLKGTSGVIFPHTPQVSISHMANYDSMGPTHSNYNLHFYKNSTVSNIVISGSFTAQTPDEADYVLACIMFFRAATKMFWGHDALAGQPPPILYLNGYGQHYFPNVPVVLKSFQNDFTDESDFVISAANATRVPSVMQVSVVLEPVYSRLKIADEFTFEKFSRGELSGNTGSPGGFI